MNISLFTIIAFLTISLNSHCQERISGIVVDSETLQELADVELSNLANGTKINTNVIGNFELFKEGIYRVVKEGYITKTIYLNFNKDYLIKLNKDLSKLDEIIVISEQYKTTVKNAKTAVNNITKKDIERYNNIKFEQVLNKNTGVFMQSGAINTNRITIRGIGSRNPFGTSKIRAYFKDIPLTNGSGETNIEDFELASLSGIHIIKGGYPRIYGAGLGGVIILEPQQSLPEETKINTEFSMDSYNLYKGILKLNYGSKKNIFNIVYSNTERDGYRENNNYSRQTISWNSNHDLNSNNEVSLLMNYINLKAFIPSSINEDTYLNSPKSAPTNWRESKGFEDTKRGIFGLSWNHSYSDKLNQALSIFSSFRNSYEPRPFNILEEDTFAYGLRANLSGHSQILGKQAEWTIGGEFFNDYNNNKTYENLYEEFPSGTGSVEGNLLSNFNEKRDYYNFFTEFNVELSSRISGSFGLNLNKTAYDLADNFPVSVDNIDQTGSFKFKSVVSPKIAFIYSCKGNHSIFTNMSHGFSPVSLNETLLPDGQINSSLKPETGWNFEIGSSGSFFSDRLNYETSIFRMAIKNLLVSRRVSEDQFIGINAGKTQHDGLELAINYRWINKTNVQLSSFVNYTLNNFKFKEFIDDNRDYSGNDLTGVPSSIINIGLDYNIIIGVYGTVNYQHIGSMPITDSNTLYTKSYNLTNIKIGYRIQLNSKWYFNGFLGLNNIFNEKYASQILINASGFNGSAPRYYYPGEPTNYYAGFNINYVF